LDLYKFDGIGGVPSGQPAVAEKGVCNDSSVYLDRLYKLPAGHELAVQPVLYLLRDGCNESIYWGGK